MSNPIETSAAANSSPASASANVRSQRRRLTPAMATRRRPPSAAPARNATRDVDERETESPGTPAAAKPRKNTLPVMLAVKMWPSPRKLTASTNPVTPVRTRSAGGAARRPIDAGETTPGRRRPIASTWRAEGAGRPEPSSRPTRRRRSRPVGQPAPEGNDSGGQHGGQQRRRRPIASRAGRPAGDRGPWVSHGRAAPGALRACVILSDSTPANAVNFSARASAEYVCVATYWCAKREEDRA